MTYNAVETSTEDGSPIELYQFNYGPNYFRYTSSAKQVIHLGNIFEPVAISRGEITDTGLPERSNLSVQMFRGVPVCDLFRVQPPSSVVSLTIFRRHESDTDNEFVVLWIGRVLDMTFEGNTAKLNTEPVFTSLKRTGLRLHYQAGCPHVLYGTGCKLVASLFGTTSNNFTVNGAVVFVQDVQTEPDGFFAGGYIEYVHAVTGNLEFLSIRASSAGNLTLSFPPVGLAEATEVTVFPGCNHTIDDCKNKFNNLLNYGGHPYIPTVNPFGGNRIY